MDDFSYFRLRIPLELKEKIEKESKKNNRSMNAQILYLIEEYFNDSQNQPNSDEQFRIITLPDNIDKEELMEELCSTVEKELSKVFHKTIAKYDIKK